MTAQPARASAEVPVISDDGPARLAGTVWLPAGTPRGLLLMHPGSGPSDRDNDVLFPPIRAALLDIGVAVCSFDKRGVGGSSGQWHEAGIVEQAGDLARGLRAARAAVPDGPVGLFGHSQGGWVVLEAARAVVPAFVITNSGPSVSPTVQEAYSTRNRLRAARWPEPDVDGGVRLFRELMDLAAAAVPFARAEQWLGDPARAERIGALADAGAFVPATAPLWELTVLLARHDPGAALAGFQTPLLAVFGALDSIVPVEDCIVRYRNLVRADLLQVALIDRGDHRMQLPDGETFAPGYLETLTGYVAAHVQ